MEIQSDTTITVKLSPNEATAIREFIRDATGYYWDLDEKGQIISSFYHALRNEEYR